jgi:hypothetical protein
LLLEQIRELTANDITQVADLHQQSGIGDSPQDMGRLCDYYRTTFIDSPWHNPNLPSLVGCDDKNQIVGFIGVLSRQMMYNKTRLNVAVAHRFMVDSRRASPMIAVRLMKRFLAGPQDLSLSDGANDQGKKFWLGCGGQISWLYSIDWFKPILPISYFMSVASRKNHRWLRGLLPIGNLIDKAYLRFFKGSISQDADELKKEPLTYELLFECIQQFSAAKILVPIYTIPEIQWLYQFMAFNTARGQLDGRRLKDKSGKNVGCYLYYLRDDGIAEVMLLCACKNRETQVYHCFLNELKQKGAIGVIGRIEPDFMLTFGQDKVLFKRGSWAMVHSRRPELMNAINSGNAFFSKLDGELCLYAPGHIV